MNAQTPDILPVSTALFFLSAKPMRIIYHILNIQSLPLDLEKLRYTDLGEGEHFVHLVA